MSENAGVTKERLPTDECVKVGTTNTDAMGPHECMAGRRFRCRTVRGDETTGAAVQNNYFRAEGAPAPSVVEWLAADGSLVKRIDLNAERAG